MLLHEGLDGGGVAGTALSAAHGVDEQGHRLPLEAELLEEAHAHDDHLCVCAGVRGAQALDAHLVELPQTALLRALAAKHRAGVEQLGRCAALGDEVVLGDGAHNAGRALWAQGQLLVCLEGLVCLEAVDRAEGEDREDLLGGGVAGLAAAAQEELRLLEDGGLDGLVAVEPEDLQGLGLEGLPGAGLGGKQVLGALGCFVCHGCFPLKQQEALAGPLETTSVVCCPGLLSRGPPCRP